MADTNTNSVVLHDPNNPAHILADVSTMDGAVQVTASAKGVIIAVGNDGTLSAQYNNKPVSFETPDGKAAAAPKVDGKSNLLFFTGSSPQTLLDLSHYTSDKKLNVALVPADPAKPEGSTASVVFGPKTSNVSVDATMVGREGHNTDALTQTSKFIIPDGMAKGATAYTSGHMVEKQETTQTVTLQLGNSNSIEMGPERLPVENGTTAGSIITNYRIQVYHPERFDGALHSVTKNIAITGNGNDVIAEMVAQMQGQKTGTVPIADSLPKTLNMMADQAATPPTKQQQQGLQK